MTFLSQFLGFESLYWLLSKFETVLIILIIIIFRPELRRFLERVGSGNLFTSTSLDIEEKSIIIQNLLKGIEKLAKDKIGALIVIERNTSLYEYIQSGIHTNSILTHELIRSLFWPGTPTHDGAIIIQSNKIVAAGCLLPLTESDLKNERLGTRHRAGIGLSELSDAFIIIISEETGIISTAENGKLTRFLTKETLESKLFSLVNTTNTNKGSLFKKLFKLR